MKKLKAIFPGSFDPFTLGHYDLVKRGLSLFEEIYIAFGDNSQKRGLFPLQERMEMVKEVFKAEENVKVLSYKGLTTDFAKTLDTPFLLRGLRNGMDLEYERPIALLNKHISSEIETVFLIPSPEYGHISSTLVRELIKYGAPLTGLVHETMIPLILKNFKQ